MCSSMSTIMRRLSKKETFDCLQLKLILSCFLSYYQLYLNENFLIKFEYFFGQTHLFAARFFYAVILTSVLAVQTLGALRR
jgi:hypothetical protein